LPFAKTKPEATGFGQFLAFIRVDPPDPRHPRSKVSLDFYPFLSAFGKLSVPIRLWLVA
jgi:hypothetical protein